jgi:hypothetical protein
MITAPTEYQKFTIRTELLADLVEAGLLLITYQFNHWDGETKYYIQEHHLNASDAEDLPDGGMNDSIFEQDELEEASHILFKRHQAKAKQASGVLVSPNS